MTTTLSEGVKVPDVGSVNWAGDLEINWNLLNGALANLSFNVKLDRDNIWTGTQTFLLPIEGSITGTASKAIADEDGTSIKTGYVNVAGNQTVTGQKTWSGNQFFTSPMYPKNTSYEIGNTPASNVAIPIYFADKNNTHTGYIRNVVLTTGRTQSELYARNKFTNGALSPTGTDVSSTLQVEVQSNGDKTLYFDGSIRNNVLPYATNTYALGSSSYQWSSVYAQSYFYNGTQWGLDKANVWSNINSFQREITLAGDRNAYVAPMWAASGSGLCLLTGDASKPVYLGNYVASGDHYTYDSSKGYLRICTGEISTINTVTIEPFGTNTQLGTSTNKWKTLNGINPGALSLPGNSYIDISGDITIRDGSATNSLTTPCDGWIAICTFASWLQIANDTLVIAVTGAIGADGFSQAFLPVRTGDSLRIMVNQTNTQFQSFRLIPCQGNV